MPSVSKLAAAAAQLSRPELRELRRQIDRLEKRTQAIMLKPRRGPRCRLVRLEDAEFMDLHRRSLAIDHHCGLDLWWHFCWQRPDRKTLNRAELYLTLKNWIGESGRCYDDWKCSFSFPFSLDVLREGHELPYLLEIRNERTSLEFSIRKVVAADDPRLQEHLVHKPFTDEFSKDDMLRTFLYLYGFLVGYWSTIKDHEHDPFVRPVASEHILFGFCDGRTFDKQYDSEEAYLAARNNMRNNSAGRGVQAFRPTLALAKIMGTGSESSRCLSPLFPRNSPRSGAVSVFVVPAERPKRRIGFGREREGDG